MSAARVGCASHAALRAVGSRSTAASARSLLLRSLAGLPPTPSSQTLPALSPSQSQAHHVHDSNCLGRRALSSRARARPLVACLTVAADGVCCPSSSSTCSPSPSPSPSSTSASSSSSSSSVLPARLLGPQRRHATTAAGLEKDYDGLWANKSFEELGLHPTLIKSLEGQGFVRPTVVQAEAFLPVAKGRDVVLRSETGSGKTLAYLLPLLNRVYHLHDRNRELANNDPDAPSALQSSRPWVVLAPTSDLCAQILAMLEAVDTDKLVAAQSLQRLCKWEALAGEPGFQAPRMKERTTLSRDSEDSMSPSSPSPSYALASPRIRWGAVDLVVTTAAKFSEELEQLKEDNIFPACMVMDEADMLFAGPNRGYLFDIFALMRPRLKIRQIDEPKQRLPDLVPTQFIFAAATMLHIGPHSAGNMIIERFCTAETVETRHFHRLPAGLSQEALQWLPGSDDWDERVDQLVDLLRTAPAGKTIVFVNSLHNCHVLLKYFRQSGWPVASFMKGPKGRMGPRFRDAKKFKDGDATLLLATDFGGRGVDWPEVNHVVNFQMPTSAVCWLHRVGRTGRIGRSGFVTNFIGSKDEALAELIQSRLKEGKDLHGAFSRRRSLPRRLKKEQEEQDSKVGVSPTDGVYRADGGLELYPELDSMGSRFGRKKGGGGGGDGGMLIGYLDETVEEEAPGVMAQRLRQQARGNRGPPVPGRGGRNAPTQEDEGLAQLRKDLLDSDSEDEDDEGKDGADREVEDSDDDDDDDELEEERRKTDPNSSEPFSWDSLQADASASDAALGPSPKRSLFEERTGEQDSTSDGRRGGRRDARRYGRAEQQGSRRHVRDTNRMAAGNNYASADDDLLL